jgi:hypothetical protein
LGHGCRAVHIEYGKRAQVTVDSLEGYEEKAARKIKRKNRILILEHEVAVPKVA